MWTSLDLAPREGGLWAKGAVGPAAPWLTSDWTCLGPDVRELPLDPECFFLGIVYPFRLPVGGAGGEAPWVDWVSIVRCCHTILTLLLQSLGGGLYLSEELWTPWKVPLLDKKGPA